MRSKFAPSSSKQKDQYFNLAKSTNTFRSLLEEYKKESNTQIPKPDSVQTILDMKKKQAEQKETDQEYLFNEMKENARLKEEMKNQFGVKNKTKPEAMVNFIQKKIKNMTKMQKEKLILKDYTGKPKNIKIVNHKIVLPLIFPKKSFRKDGIFTEVIDSQNNSNSNRHHHEFKSVDYHGKEENKDEGDDKKEFDLPKLKLKLNKYNQGEYIATLDVMRHQFSTISLLYGDYFEREKGKSSSYRQRISFLKQSIA